MYDQNICLACMLPREKQNYYCSTHAELGRLAAKASLWWVTQLYEYYVVDVVGGPYGDYYQLLILYLDAYTLGEL